ncbi:hypothetical protein MXB_2798, partial [Myxobolus squamalis]
KVLCFSGTLGPNINKNNTNVIRFNRQIVVSDIIVVPYGRKCHAKCIHSSKTCPSKFDLTVYARDVNQPNLSTYQNFASSHVKENFEISIKKECVTDILIFCGNFDYLSLNIYTRKSLNPQNTIILDKNIVDEQVLSFSNHIQAKVETIQPKSHELMSLNTQIDEYGDIETDSDNLMMDDIDFDQICIGECSATEETWLNQATQINPHQALLSKLNNIPHPSQTKFQEDLRMYQQHTITVIVTTCLWGISKNIWDNLPALVNIECINVHYFSFDVMLSEVYTSLEYFYNEIYKYFTYHQYTNRLAHDRCESENERIQLNQESLFEHFGKIVYFFENCGACGRFLLSHEYESINLLTTFLISDSKNDSHYYVLPLNIYILSDDAMASCEWMNLLDGLCLFKS